MVNPSQVAGLIPGRDEATEGCVVIKLEEFKRLMIGAADVSILRENKTVKMQP